MGTSSKAPLISPTDPLAHGPKLKKSLPAMERHLTFLVSRLRWLETLRLLAEMAPAQTHSQIKARFIPSLAQVAHGVRGRNSSPTMGNRPTALANPSHSMGIQL